MNYEPDRDFDTDERPVSSSWHKSVTADLEQSQKRAWQVAAGAGALALLLAIALVILLPLKEREPYTLLVDRQTGNVEALAPMGEQDVTVDEALTRSFLVQYVNARESYSADTVQEDYRKVALWSDTEVRRNYARRMDADNPSSPLASMPRGTVIRTEVKSVSNLEKNKAMVRFITTRSTSGGFPREPQHWVAIINYRFVAAEMSEADRFINPLGFQVTSYRRDAETVREVSDIDTSSPEPPVFDMGPPASVAPPMIETQPQTGDDSTDGDTAPATQTPSDTGTGRPAPPFPMPPGASQ